MTDRTEPTRVTHFRLGQVDGPILREPLSEQHDYAFPLEKKRSGHLEDEKTRVWVRLRSSQVVNRLEEHLRSLARWIAEGRLKDHFAKAVQAPAAMFEATDEEVEEFFREVDPQKVDQNCDGWLELPPQRRKAGF